MSTPAIMIVAGEASGDVAGALLLRALREERPDLRAIGVGGRLMREAGLVAVDDISHLAVVGFLEVISAVPRLRRVLRKLVRLMASERPRVLVLIDFPGFNLRLARLAKKRGIRVVYYISPQVWAWGARRIPRIARLVDKMLVVFPFEVELYSRFGLDVEFVGHPLLDMIPPDRGRAVPRKELAIAEDAVVIGLLPGSRGKELRAHLPIMLRAAEHIASREPGTSFLVACADTLDEHEVKRQVGRLAEDIPIQVLKGKTQQVILASDVVVVASGTATLETACLERPMVIMYRVSIPTWLCVRPLIRVPYIGLVNIVAGKKIVPEYLQFHARPLSIAHRVIELLGDIEERDEMVHALGAVRTRLGEPGASRRAARAILAQIGGDGRWMRSV